MTGQRKLFLLVIISIFLNLIFAQDGKLYILHTNNTNGALENCYCPVRPFGSVEKRSIYFSNFLKENPNTLILDSGDIFTMTHQSLKDSLMAEAYNLLSYDAILFGDQELTMDSSSLAQLTSQMETNIIATNIAYPGVLKSHIVVKNKLRIAILGIVDPYALKYYPKEIKDKIILTDPVKAVKAEMKKLKRKADIFILMTHQGADLDYVIAEKIKGLDVIIGAHSQSALEKPEVVNGALITQAGKEGYYIGVIELQTNKRKVVSQSGKIDTMKLEMPDDPIIMEMIEEYEKRSGRINHRKLDLKGNH
jgi:2',3'-cyclic-nucleotide 2'-phosphodiesterase (5'-nucleotidase family)|tara:strand:- start:1669 stop:2589 length:921 start_codon:yes stop_codon:yes gene_type:complete